MTYGEDIKDISTRGALVATAIGLIVVALVLGIFVFRSTSVSSANPSTKKYQAVVLRNGQVYFGHLAGLGSAYATLSDVYYIKNDQNQTQATASPGSNLTLVTLGDELPQPEQTMQIASDQIVYYETMKDDSKVVDAIKKAKEKK